MLLEKTAPISTPNATYAAPVSVATSHLMSVLLSLAKARASAIINLPSASVFITSIVLPFLMFQISPGLIAVPLGIFSTMGV